jgi:hypothetical protein
MSVVIGITGKAMAFAFFSFDLAHHWCRILGHRRACRDFTHGS